MKRTVLIFLLLLAAVDFAGAQLTKSATDVLGAHLNYGRGCSACHAPHSGSAAGSRLSQGDAVSRDVPLWGPDVSQLYGKTMATGGGKFVEVLPSTMAAGTPDVAGVMTCMSCHDGNYAQQAMMKNQVYEQVPASSGGSSAIPTLIGRPGMGMNSYLAEHPLGLNAKMKCGNGRDWDCSVAGGEVRMTGPKSSMFVRSYGFFVKPAKYQNSAVIVCTTCHDQHRMSTVTVADNSVSGLPPGTYSTMFFLRGPYNLNDRNPKSNQTAQFCRQCHADKSNEWNGSTAETIF